MKIFVINLNKLKKRKIIAAVTVLLLVLIASLIAFMVTTYSDDLLFSPADTIPYDKIIILDAGHGGEDPGAVGVDGVLEKDINLAIVMEMGKILEDQGYIVIYTRTDDRMLYEASENIKGIRKISDLKNRCKIAERYPEAIFVSIHMNSFAQEKYSGLQVYYAKGNDEGSALANSIQNKVKSDIQNDNNRVTKPAENMYLLENISNTAVIIECGFLTNKNECEKLSEKEYQKQLSFSIVCGIIEYMNK